MTVITTVISD